MKTVLRFLMPWIAFTFLAGVLVGVADGDSSSQSNSVAERDTGCLSDPSVLEELRSQRENLVKARKDLAAKEDELKVREQAVGEEMKKLQALREEITKGDSLRKKENQEKVAKVIETIETMSPKASAKMVAELDDALSVEVISRMDTVKLAKIMNLLDPKRAARLNEILAGIARAKASTSAPTAVASNDRASNSRTEKGGEKDDGQNHDNSNTAQRQPGSTGKAIGSR